jgi:hypothetical protein
MATTRNRRRIPDTPSAMHQVGSGPSVLALVTVATGLIVLILVVAWFVFFRP